MRPRKTNSVAKRQESQGRAPQFGGKRRFGPVFNSPCHQTCAKALTHVRLRLGMRKRQINNVKQGDPDENDSCCLALARVFTVQAFPPKKGRACFLQRSERETEAPSFLWHGSGKSRQVHVSSSPIQVGASSCRDAALGHRHLLRRLAVIGTGHMGGRVPPGAS